MKNIFGFFLVIILILSHPCFANTGTKNAGTTKMMQNSPNYSALLINQKTSQIIYQYNADKKRYPASLTKVMTLYMIFEALEKKKITMDTVFVTSKNAASKPRCKLHLKPGEKVSVRNIILSLIIKSANDAATVYAEGIAGSEAKFGQMMTAKARTLGMKNTKFKNPSGLPNPEQYTNAKDMAILANAIKRDFPQYYHLFASKSFNYKGRVINTHNRIVAYHPNATGLKTGYINASGHNIMSTTKSKEGELLAIIFGAQTKDMRDKHAKALLEKGRVHLATNQKTLLAKNKNKNVFTAAKTNKDKKPATLAKRNSVQAIASSSNKDPFSVIIK